jgi:hypothetical protein
MGASFRWNFEVVHAGLRPADSGERRTLLLDDIDLAELGRRYVEESRGTPASFRTFREIWKGERNRKSLTPRACIVPAENALFRGPSPVGLRRLAVVWTLGPAELRDQASGDILVEFLLEAGTTFLLFEMWRRIVAYVEDLWRLGVFWTLQPSDAGQIRSIFGPCGPAGMKDVYLNPEGIIVPAKSRCAFIALSGTPGAKTPEPPRCRPCAPKSCAFHRMGLCPVRFQPQSALQ